MAAEDFSGCYHDKKLPMIKNCSRLPKEVSNATQERRTYISSQKPFAFVMVEGQEGCVYALNTSHVSVRTRNDLVHVTKPDVVLDYNIPGVDHGDQLMGYCPFQCISIKLWKKASTRYYCAPCNVPMCCLLYTSRCV